MPITCDVDRFYYGTDGLLDKLYAGDVLVWPCYNCDTHDPVYARARYSDALLYIPKICIPMSTGAEYLIEDAKSNVQLDKGPAYNGLWSVALAGQTWGFMPPVTAQIGELIVEGELPTTIDIIGNLTSSLSFYLTLTDDISTDDQGILMRIAGMEVELIPSVFFGTTILARVDRSGDSLEIQSTTDLPLDEEIEIIVYYKKDPPHDMLRIYYGSEIVAEVIE